MIALIPWVDGARPAWPDGRYTKERVRWTADQFCKAASDIPMFIATPHVEHRSFFEPYRLIDCGPMMSRFGMKECGVMTAAYHPALDHLHVVSITADTLVLKKPTPFMVKGRWTAPQQHIPIARPYGDWIVGLPPKHPIRAAVYKTFTTRPGLQVKFDKYVCQTAASIGHEPVLVKPPTIINGEWIAEGWQPWCQPLTEETVAVHPHSHTKWPEFAASHTYFAHLPSLFARELTFDMIERQCAAHIATSGVPEILS